MLLRPFREDADDQFHRLLLCKTRLDEGEEKFMCLHGSIDQWGQVVQRLVMLFHCSSVIGVKPVVSHSPRKLPTRR